MTLKTYRAASMVEALSAVKRDFGKDAVILHTRSVKVGGFLGIGAKTAIEITASDEPVGGSRRARTREAAAPAQPVHANKAAEAARAYRQVAQAPAPAAPVASAQPVLMQQPVQVHQPAQPVQTAPQPAPVGNPPTADELGVMRVREKRALGPMAPEPIRTGAPQPRVPATVANLAPVDAAASATLARELADIKLLVNQVLHSSPKHPEAILAGTMPEALFSQYLRLLESSVSRDLADQVITSVRQELSAYELEDPGMVRTAILRHIAGLIPVCEGVTTPTRGPRPLVIALVGPTGVGKTTTIAKLAAAYKLRSGRSVALITADTYRIAAVDQLRTYAGIIGLPLKVVLSPQEMASAVESFADYEVVLIDTAGRSQFNADRIAELSSFLQAARPDEVHLVLSTTASEAVLLKTAEQFAPVRPNRILLTKLDEAVNFGVVVNVVRRLQTRLSFVTTGQEVPDHIEAGHSERLARMVLDNGFAPIATTRRPAARETRDAVVPELAGLGVGVGA